MFMSTRTIYGMITVLYVMKNFLQRLGYWYKTSQIRAKTEVSEKYQWFRRFVKLKVAGKHLKLLLALERQSTGFEGLYTAGLLFCVNHKIVFHFCLCFLILVK